MPSSARYRKRARVDSLPSSLPTISDTEDEPASSLPESEKEKFNRRFDTANKSNDEVLGQLSLFNTVYYTEFHVA